MPGVSNEFIFASLYLPEEPCFKRLISWDLSHCRKKGANDDSEPQKPVKQKPAEAAVEKRIVDLFGLRESDLDEKLHEFKGLGTNLDAQTSKVLGKLLEEDYVTKSNADFSTYYQIFGLICGSVPLIIFICYAQFQKFWENYNQRVDAEFAAIDPEKQGNALTDYLM